MKEAATVYIQKGREEIWYIMIMYTQAQHW